MSQYFTRRLTRSALQSVTDEVQAMHGAEPLLMSDGLIIFGPDEIPILRAIDLGEPHLVVLFHRKIFQELTQ